MTPRLTDLALRAIAAGAPEPRHEPGGMGHTLPGEVDVGGLIYECVVVEGAVRLLPLLSHWSWLGWTLAEVRRRGYWWTVSARGAWAVDGPSPASADPSDIPAALVAMLEAAAPLRGATDQDSSPP